MTEEKRERLSAAVIGALPVGVPSMGLAMLFDSWVNDGGVDDEAVERLIKRLQHFRGYENSVAHQYPTARRKRKR